MVSFSSMTATDLNKATQKELMKVPQIGATLSKRIVATRLQHGRFTNWKTVEKIDGMGWVRTNNLKSVFTIDEEDKSTEKADKSIEKVSKKVSEKVSKRAENGDISIEIHLIVNVH